VFLKLSSTDCRLDDLNESTARLTTTDLQPRISCWSFLDFSSCLYRYLVAYGLRDSQVDW
jgi:hypothetical protein